MVDLRAELVPGVRVDLVARRVGEVVADPAEIRALSLHTPDFYNSGHQVTAHATGALEPHELLRVFIHYKHVDYYDPALFDRAYDWMKARGMTEGQSQHGALVVG